MSRLSPLALLALAALTACGAPEAKTPTVTPTANPTGGQATQASAAPPTAAAAPSPAVAQNAQALGLPAPSLAPLVKRLSPAVVSIDVEQSPESLGSGSSMMSVGNVGAGNLGKQFYDFGGIGTAPDSVDHSTLIGDLCQRFYGEFNFIHLGCQFGQVGIGGEHGSGQGAEMPDQVDAVILFVRAGELMFPKLA